MAGWYRVPAAQSREPVGSRVWESRSGVERQAGTRKRLLFIKYAVVSAVAVILLRLLLLDQRKSRSTSCLRPLFGCYDRRKEYSEDFSKQ